jgi:hypothetical protein
MKFIKEFAIDWFTSIFLASVLVAVFHFIIGAGLLTTILIALIGFCATKLITRFFLKLSIADIIDVIQCFRHRKSHSMPWVKVEDIQITLTKNANKHNYERSLTLSPILYGMTHYVQHVNAMGRKINFKNISCNLSDIQFHEVKLDTEMLGEFQVLKFVLTRTLKAREKIIIGIVLEVDTDDFVPLLGIHIDNYIVGKARLSVELDYVPSAFVVEELNGGQITKLSEIQNKQNSKRHTEQFNRLRAKNRYRIRWTKKSTTNQT